jgi:hypothetical protein
LRPSNSPASSAPAAAALQRSSSGDKAVNCILDVLRKLSQAKSEADEKLEGLHQEMATTLDQWSTAELLLTELREEYAQLQTQSAASESAGAG